MNGPSKISILLGLSLLASACGRGCSGDPLAAVGQAPVMAPGASAVAEANAPPSAATVTGAGDAGEAAFGAQAVGAALGLTLPDRRNDAVLPALNTLPRRRLREFRVDRQLIVRVDRKTLRVLDSELSVSALVEDAPITTALRQAAQTWGQRSGVAATRLVLAFDKDVDRELAARVRRQAHIASSWRVVALAVEGDELYEVMLDPPPDRRP